MYQMKSDLIKFINLYPTRGLFCEMVGVDEATLSNVLAERRPLPQSMMVSIQKYTGWPFDSLFEPKD